MNKLTNCIMWISCAIVAVTGIVITKDLESAVWIMMIPLVGFNLYLMKNLFQGEK